MAWGIGRSPVSGGTSFVCAKADSRPLLFVNAVGNVRRPPHDLEVTNCDFKIVASSLSRRNMKSSGNRTAFRFTAWFSTLTSTPYIAARSASRMTR